MFTLPLLVMALDGIRHSDHHPVNESAFWTDCLTMLGGIGCMISSILTLLVFFPRSVSEEAGFRAHNISKQQESHSTTIHKAGSYHNYPTIDDGEVDGQASPSVAIHDAQREQYLNYRHSLWRHQSDLDSYNAEMELDDLSQRQDPFSHQAGKRQNKIDLQPSRPPSAPPLHPYIASYTSPIDLLHYAADEEEPPSNSRA